MKGLSYSFFDEKNNKIKLDAKILDEIKLKPGIDNKYVRESSIEFDDEIFIGYRAWKVTEASGVIGNVYDVQDVNTKQLVELRNASK